MPPIMEDIFFKIKWLDLFLEEESTFRVNVGIFDPWQFSTPQGISSSYSCCIPYYF